MGKGIVIRARGIDDLATMLDGAAAEGWNPGVHDAAAFFAADPDGFLGLELVDHRGEGLGLELFNAALARAKTTTIGLDEVLEQEPNYAGDGFVTAHHSVRFGGAPPSLGETNGVRELGRADVDVLVAFERDHELFPGPRPAFLEHWITAPGTTACAIGDDDRIDGYGIIRVCRDRHKVGPLFCADRTTAERLLAGLLTHVDGGPVFLDVPVPNAEGSALARDLGLERCSKPLGCTAGRRPSSASTACSA